MRPKTQLEWGHLSSCGQKIIEETTREGARTRCPGGEDLFVHHSEVEGVPASLTPRVEVEYEVGRNERGPNARRGRIMT
jgi:cold shock CspA family protein